MTSWSMCEREKERGREGERESLNSVLLTPLDDDDDDDDL